MKNVSILIPRGHFSLVNVAGTYQMLSWVNEFLGQEGQDPLFHLHLVGLSKSMTQPSGFFITCPQLLLDEVKKTDLIILPAVHGEFQYNLNLNAELIPWLINHYRSGAEIASFCVGTFLLAATGLLDGKPSSTHWQFANEFRKLFPRVQLMDHRILTEAGGIYTSGGAYSFTNLIIYLIEKFAGRDVAVNAAKVFMIDIDRTCQSPFIIFAGQKAHQDQVILYAQEYIEKNFSEKITIEELASMVRIGRRTFERRFKKATSNTVAEYIQRVKMEAAKKQLETEQKMVSEVMYDVGYNDVKAFRDVFRKMTGMSPLGYRNKYYKEIMLERVN
jgi:transcriptional regulator GlxA family with amidase domain